MINNQSEHDIRFIKLFLWPLILAFIIIGLIALAVYDMVQDNQDHQMTNWQQLTHEQRKLTHLTNLLTLRTQLKLGLGNAVYTEPSQRYALFRHIARLRVQIVAESEKLKQISNDYAERKLVYQHSQRLEDSLYLQYYYESLLMDFELSEEAGEFFFAHIRPSQDNADMLLSDFYQLIRDKVDSLEKSYLASQAESTDQVLAAIRYGVLGLFIMFLMLGWFFYVLKNKFEFYAHYLKTQIDLRTHELKVANSEAQHSLAELQTLLRSAPDGILQVSLSGDILGVNPAVERIFGYKDHELLGKNVAMLMPERFRSSHHQNIRQFTHSNRPQPMMMGMNGIVYAQHKQGQEFPIQAAIGEITDGEYQGYTVIVRDVTNQVELERLNQNQQWILDALWQAKIGRAHV
jgi:PAS domain S-box-containing protein